MHDFQNSIDIFPLPLSLSHIQGASRYEQVSKGTTVTAFPPSHTYIRGHNASTIPKIVKCNAYCQLVQGEHM